MKRKALPRKKDSSSKKLQKTSYGSIYAPSVKTELKSIDANLSVPATALGQWSINLGTGVAAGTAANQRIGRTVKVVSLQTRFSVAFGASGVPLHPYRFVLIYDRQPTGTAPTDLDIFTSASSLAQPNLDNAKRFLFLWDFYSDFQPSTAQECIFKKDIFFKTPLVQVYNAAGNITTGQFIFCCVSTGAIPVSTVFISVRSRYMDS